MRQYNKINKIDRYSNAKIREHSLESSDGHTHLELIHCNAQPGDLDSMLHQLKEHLECLSLVAGHHTELPRDLSFMEKLTSLHYTWSWRAVITIPALPKSLRTVEIWGTDLVDMADLRYALDKSL